MKTRQMVSAVTAVALVMAGVLLTAPAASAEDAVVDETTVAVEEVVTEPVVAVEEPAPAPAEPVVEPEAVETPATPVEAVSEAQNAPEEQKVELSQQGQPDFICDESGEGWQAKVNNDNDDNIVTVTAPEGFLIDAYCVKAGTTKHIIEVAPPAASVGIDHPEKDSVSHYQVHLVTAPDDDPDPVLNECTPTTGSHSTNLNDLWSNVDTRSAGHLEYVDGGLHVWTDDNSSQAKVSEGMAVNYPLHDVGVIDIDWTGTTPPPGVNLFVSSVDGNFTLVYEGVYGQDLWLTNGAPQAVKDNAPVNGGGNGSQWHGTIDQWLTKYPTATVVGIAYSLGSGVLGDGIIHSITVGCATHTFDAEQEIVPLPEDYETVLQWQDPVITCDMVVDQGVPVDLTIERHVFSYDGQYNVVETISEYIEEATYIVTADDIAGLECEEEPTPTPVPVPVPAGNDTPDSGLAVTGGGVSPLLPIGGAAVLLLGLISAVAGALRHRAQVQ